MSLKSRSKFLAASRVWQTACERLGVRIVAPFVLEYGDEKFDCLGFLPDFGSERGMLISPIEAPNFSSDKRLSEVAKKKAMFVSFVNVDAYVTDADDVVFEEAFNDWGYYGERENCPPWFNGIRGSKALP